MQRFLLLLPLLLLLLLLVLLLVGRPIVRYLLLIESVSPARWSREMGGLLLLQGGGHSALVSLITREIRNRLDDCPHAGCQIDSHWNSSVFWRYWVSRGDTVPCWHWNRDLSYPDRGLSIFRSQSNGK